MERRYNVCICTYLRPKSLRRCLEALGKQEVESHNRIFELTIIDNDANQSAKASVSAFQSSVFKTVRYANQPKRGIPFARNHAIALSLSTDADFLIFLDDDEEPATDWLQQLCAFSDQLDGKVIVHGEVVNVLPQETPPAIQSLFNKKESKPTGTELDTCATNNVLIPRAVFDRSSLRFDTSEPLAGGTDTLFFSLARRTGYTIVQSEEARVFEHVHPSRVNLRWLMRRKFRAGITDFKRKRADGKSIFYLLIGSVLHTGLYFFAALFYTVAMKKSHKNESLLNLSRASGRLWSFFGGKYNAYQVVDSTG